MSLPENVKISEKVPSEMKQGASSDNTSICPIIPCFGSSFGGLQFQNQATENHQTFNSKCDGSVVSTEGPAYFRKYTSSALARPMIHVVR